MFHIFICSFSGYIHTEWAVCLESTRCPCTDGLSSRMDAFTKLLVKALPCRDRQSWTQDLLIFCSNTRGAVCLESTWCSFTDGPSSCTNSYHQITYNYKAVSCGDQQSWDSFVRLWAPVTDGASKSLTVKAVFVVIKLKLPALDRLI